MNNVPFEVPETDELWQFSLRKDRLRKVRHRQGRYLLRTNLEGRDPAQMWEFYIQLVQAEEAFKIPKGGCCWSARSSISRRNGSKRTSSWLSLPRPYR